MQARKRLRQTGGLTLLPAEAEAGIFNEALRKRERPFAERLVPENVPVIERASYAGAYKGVTDLLTTYLWPTWAFHLTRLPARFGVSPNQLTATGSARCVVARIPLCTASIWHGSPN